MEKLKKLPDAEFDVMKVIWDNEPPVTTTSVREQLGKEKEWKIQGCAPLDDVAEALGVRLPTDTYDTFNGFICSIIGRVPKNGERFECEFSGVRVKVHSVENHRIGNTTLHLIDENPLPC